MTYESTTRRLAVITPLASSILALAALGTPAPTAAQTGGELQLEGSARVRYEAYDGGFRPGKADSEDALLLRTILKGRYSAEGFGLGATLQDSRAYAVDASTPLGTSDVNALELVELYAAIDLGAEGTLTLGRQTISLGSKRLVGNPKFRNTSNGFTGARFDLGGEGRFTAFYVLPQVRLPSGGDALLDNEVEWDRESDDLRFWGLFYQRPVTAGFTAEAYVYGLDEDDREDKATRNRHLVTPGARVFSKPAPGGIDVELEGAFQLGTIRRSKAADAGKTDVEAFTLHGELGYTIAAEWSPRLSVFGDVATGDDAGDDDYNRFDPLFGPRRGDWGPTGLFGPLGRTNIRSLGAMVEAKPSDRISGHVSYRRLWLDSPTDAFSKTKVVDSTGAAGRDAGHQVEARLRIWLVPGALRLETGAAWLGKGTFFDRAPNAAETGDTRYGYSALSVSF